MIQAALQLIAASNVAGNMVAAAKLLQQEIAKGNTEAQTHLDRLFANTALSAGDLNSIGVMYHDGKDVKQDFIKAKAWYEKAKEKGSGMALKNSGLLYEDGHSVTKDAAIAAKHYQQAIEKEYKDAQKDLDRLFADTTISSGNLNAIGVMYTNADGVTRNYERAKVWFEKAKEKGSAAAFRNLGFCYEHGYGVEKNFVTAAKHYQQALDKGYISAQTDLDRVFAHAEIDAANLVNIGNLYHNANDVTRNYAKAKLWYEKAKEKDNTFGIAYNNLGLLYEYGNGVEKNFITAAKYYQQAVEKGYTEAQIKLDRIFAHAEISAADLANIGRLYHTAEDILLNYEQARRWYEKAKEKDSTLGTIYNNIGLLYEHGNGVEKNFITAAKYYQQAVEKGYTEAQIKLDRIFAHAEIDAANLVNIGNLYHNANDVTRNYAKAKLWYEKAKEKDNMLGIAYNNLGLLYEYGNGVEKNFITAAKYYQQAVEKGYTEAQIKLDRIFAHAEIDAANLVNIGNLYHNANDVTRNYPKAKLWYEKAKEKDNTLGIAYNNLGLLYEYGNGVEKNFITAAKYYQQAFDRGYVDSQANLDRLLANAEISASDLNNIGVVYSNTDGVTRNYEKALIWFQKSKAKECASAYRNLGTFYEYGRGVVKNVVVAAKYYRQAIEKGHAVAQADLDRLFADASVSAEDFNRVGIMYHNADGVTRNYERAKLWYEKAKEKDHAAAYRNLGIFYAEGRVVGKNAVTAAKYFQQAIEKGYAAAQEDLDRLFASAELSIADLNAIGAMYHAGGDIKQDFNKARKWYEGSAGRNIAHAKTHLKKLERDRIIRLVRDEKGELLIDQKDDKKNTALHRAAKDGRLKNCARLLFLSASKDTYNAEIKKPFNYLLPEQQAKVEKLQTQLNTLIANLEEKAPPILVGRVFSERGVNKVETEAALEVLYRIEQIKPLMNLAKLAVLGLHDLSRRKKFSTNDYDSDEDGEEKLSVDGDEYFKIRLDAKSETVQGICHCGHDGQEGKEWFGVYTYTNTLFIGGARAKPAVRGTLVHELTHFIANEVYENNCKPYIKDSKINKPQFEKIADDLSNRQHLLDPILQGAFSESYRRNDQIHGELIVRVPQMIVTLPNGLELLRAQAPALLNYYSDVFLEAVKQHSAKLEQRALGNWPLELFTQNRRNPYSLQM